MLQVNLFIFFKKIIFCILKYKIQDMILSNMYAKRYFLEN